MQSPNAILIIDTETTGIRPPGGVTAVGALVVSVRDWQLDEVLSEYAALNDPHFPIPPDVQKLTGITNDLVAGKSVDLPVLQAMGGRVDFIVAHNAVFDRGWLGRIGFAPDAPWLCSKSYMDWSDIHECNKLQCLALKLRCEGEVKHNALHDAYTLMRVLKHHGALQRMVESYRIPRRILRATGAPFTKKDLLKESGFLWSAEDKVWWRVITPDDETTMRELFTRVYGHRAPWHVSDVIDPTDPNVLVEMGLEAAA